LKECEYLRDRIRQAVLFVMGGDDDRKECGQDSIPIECRNGVGNLCVSGVPSS
jgi:hypothetical protein